VSETIKSVISQSYSNIEIVIVDNCSTDGTWAILEQFSNLDSRIKIYRNESNIGPVRNWKKCIELASGEYIKILFSDDLISFDYINECVTKFDRDTGFVMSAIQPFREGVNHPLKTFKEFIYTREEYLYEMIIQNKKGFPVSPGNAIFRKADIVQSLLIDINNPWEWDFSIFGAGPDLLIMCITASKYKYIKTTNNVISYFREHINSISGEKTRGLRKYYEFSKVYFVNNYYNKLENDLKTRYFFKQFSSTYDDAFYKETKGRFKINCIIKMLFHK
jgi:glycosyltransferase involved in cell wall biosynthesis